MSVQQRVNSLAKTTKENWASKTRLYKLYKFLWYAFLVFSVEILSYCWGLWVACLPIKSSVLYSTLILEGKWLLLASISAKTRIENEWKHCKHTASYDLWCIADKCIFVWLLKVNFKLRVLNLSHNEFGDVGGRHFAHAICECSCLLYSWLGAVETRDWYITSKLMCDKIT